MAWVESHQDLRDHPKMAKFRRRLGLSLPAAIGHLHLLWWWSLSYAEDGKLGRHDDDVIADAGGWEGDAAAFVEALIVAGFLDDDRTIHDWDHYTGRLQERREANRLRQQRWREKNATPPSTNSEDSSTNGVVTCDEGVSNALNQPTVNQPTNQPVNQPEPTNQPEYPSPNPSPQAGKGLAKPGRRRRRDEPVEEPVTPLTPADREQWAAAVAALARSMLPSLLAGVIRPLEPIGRAQDGGLLLRAPPRIAHDALGLVPVFGRALESVGDEHGQRAAIVK